MNIYPQRRSIRLKGYDYTQAGLYFITLCCTDRLHVFGHIRNGIMCLNPFGIIAYQAWMETPLIRPNIRLGAFIVMPNHMHSIIEIRTSALKHKENTNTGILKGPSQTIGAIIRGYKGSTTKRIKEYIFEHSRTGELQFNSNNSNPTNLSTGELQFAPTESKFAPTELINLKKSIWQRNYYEHIIRTDRAFQNISNYIENNPLNWKRDKFS